MKKRFGLKNKKAQVYPVFVAIFTLLALTYALISLSTAKKITDNNGNEILIGQKQAAVFVSLQDADSTNLFLEQAANLAAQKAMDELRNSCFKGTDTESVVDNYVSPCGKYIYPQWSTNETLCLPDCETAFLNAFKDDLLARTDNYSKLTGVELPISYHLEMEKFENYFLLHGIADSQTGFNVLSIQARIETPVMRSLDYYGGKFIWPVDYKPKTISSCFGWRKTEQGTKDHPGVDIAATKGTPVLAAASGKVVQTDPCWGLIVINHGSGLSSEYLHLDTIGVKVDQDVAQGETIGTVGGRGNEDGAGCKSDAYPPHLHFAVRYKNAPANLNYEGQDLVLHSFGAKDHIQPECLLEKPDAKIGSGCNLPVNIELDKICSQYNLPPGLLTSNVGGETIADTSANSATANVVTGNVATTDTATSNAASSETLSSTTSSQFGSYLFKPGFTTRVNKKIEDPLLSLTNWFKDAWDNCTDDPKKCINEKMSEFNKKNTSFKLYFADRCEENPVLYDLLEFVEDCLSNGKFKCSCSFDMAKANIYSRKDLAIIFDTENNKATLFAKEKKVGEGTDAKDSYVQFGEEYQFYYGKLMPATSSQTRYSLLIDFDESTGKLKTARFSSFGADASNNALNPALDAASASGSASFDSYTTIKLAKLEKSDEAIFINKNDIPSCEYVKDKFRLCAIPDKEKTELMTMKFALQLKDKPPEPVKQGEVTIIETELGAKSDVDNILSAAGFLSNVFPPVGYLFSAMQILSVLDDSRSRTFQVITDVPLGPDGKPLDIAGYEVYCNDYLTNLLPKDVIDNYNPQSFVVMANSELNAKASQLDKYVDQNPYADFIAGNACDVPVSKTSGETVLVPGTDAVFKDGKMVFNLNKCNDASIIIDKVLRKSYCVSLVPVDKNGNKLTDQVVSNCAQTNSLLDLAVTEMLEKKFGEFLPSSLIPEDLKPYIKLPDASDIADAALGNKDLNLAQAVSFDKLDDKIQGFAESFIAGNINNELVSSSIINSMEGMNIWEKQTVLNTLSSKITDADAKLVFDNLISGGESAEGLTGGLAGTVSSLAQQTAIEKGIDYLDQSKAPELLKQAAKTQDPESFAYNEMISAANNQLSSDEKKQLLVEMVNSKNSDEVKDALVEKAVQKGCAADYSVSTEQAANCLSNDEINEVFSDMLSGYNSVPSTRQELLEQSITKLDENGKSPEVLKQVVKSGDFKGAAQDMLLSELNKLPDDSKKAFVSDILEGRMTDAGTLQTELIKLIPEVNNQYFNALIKDGNVQSLLKDGLEVELKKQLGMFLDGECVPKVVSGTI